MMLLKISNKYATMRISKHSRGVMGLSELRH